MIGAKAFDGQKRPPPARVILSERSESNCEAVKDEVEQDPDATHRPTGSTTGYALRSG